MKSKIALSVFLSLVIVLTGCSAAWVSTIDSILAAAAPALIDILQIVSVAEGKPYNTALATKINQDAADLKKLAADFSANSNSHGCQLLQASISTYQGDIQTVLQVAQVSDPNTQNKVILLTGLVAGTVQAIVAVIPSCQAPASIMRAMAVQPPAGTRQFVISYNRYLTAKTGNPQVDKLTPTLKIHQHSAFVRVVSLGLAK